MGISEKPLLAAALAATSLGLIIEAPSIIALPSAVLFSLTSVYSWEELRQRSVGEIFKGVGQLTLELTGLVEPAPDTSPKKLDPLTIPYPETIADFLKGSLPESDPTTPEFWTPHRANRSAILVGTRGSGKSKLFAYRFQQCVAHNVRALISDIHFDADDEERTDWLPGVEESVLVERFLISTVEDTLKALQAHRSAALRRLEGKESAKQPLHLFIDEWLAVWQRWDSRQQQQALAALQTIFHEGRKAKVNVSLCLHSFKEKMSGLDSSLALSGDLYILGSASIADRHNQFPTDLDCNQLAKERTEAILRHGLGSAHQRVLIFRDYGTGTAKVVVSPNLLVPVAFQLDPADDPQTWIESRREELEALIEDGFSLRKLTDKFNIPRRADNPKYQALKLFIEQHSA